MTSKRRILKNALSFIQSRDGLNYDSALTRIAHIIATGEHGDNPLFADLIHADIPSNPVEIHQLMTPNLSHA